VKPAISEFGSGSVTVFWRDVTSVVIMVLGAAHDIEHPDPAVFRSAQTCVKFY
jgi:hypothetical protein